jgi:hypothetical protein
MRSRGLRRGVVALAAVVLSTLTLGVGTAHAAPPANDAFASATVISGTSGSLTSTNVDATTEVDEPEVGGGPAFHSVWFTWTAPSDGFLVTSTVGSAIDSQIAIYEGATLATLDQLAARQDTGEQDGGRAQAEVQGGQAYLVQVSSEEEDDTGAYKLAWRLAQSPANDDFAAAQVVPAW